jgi:ribose 1,5-bisphosphokinase PhnN
MSPGGVKTPMESLTTTWQAGGGAFGIGVALNTQLMAGAATSTTESGAACAPEAAPKSPAAAMTATRNEIFTVICLPSKKILPKYAYSYS